MYTGKEVCQGCQKPGSELPRYEKNRLCVICEKSLASGRSKDHESNVKYDYIFQHWYAFSNKETNRLIHELLKALNNPFATRTGELKSIQWQSGNNGAYYKIPEGSLEVIGNLFRQIDAQLQKMEKELADLPQEKIKALEAVRNNERDTIFREGVERGKSLLFQLNNGEITLDDFDKQQHR